MHYVVLQVISTNPIIYKYFYFLFWMQSPWLEDNNILHSILVDSMQSSKYMEAIVTTTTYNKSI